MSKIRKIIIAVAVVGMVVPSMVTSVAARTVGKKAAGVRDPLMVINKNPYPSTYKPFPSVTTMIRGATILTGTGKQLEGASVLMENGKIIAVGKNLKIPYGTEIIDGKGKWVTPGIIDVHSHLGVYASPNEKSLADGNEATRPVTADVWAEHSVWPEDPGFSRAIAGGVTTLQILPGSANLIGGRGVTLKNVPSRTMEGMKFPDAPYGLKMACGENPKRVYGKKGGPSTRMGNMAGYREAWIKARRYKKQWDDYTRDYKAGKNVKAPKEDLGLDSLMGVLNGKIRVHIHCYRADEMVNMIDMAKEFHY
ncbi:MAG: amidohydrolase, partial [Alphaproteobacteria bacterium]|nr:amidohydrolase [Alphaproteobacteria bacterium]